LKFLETEIAGVYEIEAEPRHDERGFFARIYCPDEFAASGVDFRSTQINLSRNTAPFTLRGMHWQDPPFAEAKLVRATAGAAHDVVVDLRRDSPTFRRWIARRLDAKLANALYIPEGCAHGFLTLEPETDLLYQMSRPFVPGQARGMRFDDPGIGIAWPAAPAVVSEADLAWPSPWEFESGGNRG
jgi:dTDP-4-dehydrorhamnose 3,5-epimerase